MNDLIEVDRVGDTLILRPLRLSPLSASRRGQLQDHLVRLAQTSPDRRVWLDFQTIEHLDNAALSLIVYLQQHLAGKAHRLLLANLRPQIRDHVAVCNLEHLLDIRIDLPTLSLPSPPSVADGFLHGIIQDPADPDFFLLGTNRGAYVSEGGGGKWLLLDAPFGDAAVFSLVMAPSDSSTIYAATQAGAYVSRDRGASWTALSVSGAATRIVPAR